jgi:ribosomal protein S18 acetylase RimI-like enzyme
MPGVDEAHLLNIAVARSAQGQGLARWMLLRLDDMCRAQALPVIWLEVRPSNEAALALYRAQQYAHVAIRKDYYPAIEGQEDAWVMKREVPHVEVD